MLYHRIVIIIFCISIFVSPATRVYARVADIDDLGESTDDREQPEIGNFALRTTQQPGPLFGFGQNINTKGDLQVFTSPNKIGGTNFSFSELFLLADYALTDVCTVLVALPVALSRRTKSTSFFSLIPVRSETNDRDVLAKQARMPDPEEQEEILLKSSGVEDLIIQAEYAIVDKETPTSELQTTLIGTIILPTGSATKQPNTGLGSPAFFFGTTINYQTLYWYVYGDAGYNITTKKNGLKFGNSLTYQVGFEGIIAYKPKKFILAWIFEVFNIHTKKDIVMNQKNPDSGSHLIFAAPSLWFSTNHFVFQIGVGVPVYQKLTGVQNKTSYYLNTNIAWTFSLQ